MMYPLVLELAADRIPVAVTCRVLGFSKQAFYAWRKSPVSRRDWENAHLTNAAVDAHRDDPTFGYRFIADDLGAAGHRASERRVWRLCSQQRLWSLHAKKRGLTRKAGPPVHDDRSGGHSPPGPGPAVVDRHHRAQHGRGQALSLRREGRLLPPHRGLLDRRPDAVLPRGCGAADGDLAPEPVRNSHSFRPRQPVSLQEVRSGALSDAGLLGSMGRVGACADNAAMESFFALLQKNVLNRRRWASREQLRLAIVHWIEGTYHRKRRQRGLGKLTPIEYEAIINAQVALAA